MESFKNQLNSDISPPQNYTFKEIVSHKSIIQDWEQATALYVSIATQKHNVPMVKLKTPSTSSSSVTKSFSFEGTC